MSLVADTWHHWCMLEIQEAMQIYDKWEQDSQRATDVEIHDLKSYKHLFSLFRFLEWRNFSLLIFLFGKEIAQRVLVILDFSNFKSILNSFPGLNQVCK